MFRSLFIRALPAWAVLLLAVPAWAGAATEALEVPTVTGKSKQEAVALLKKAGLQVRAIQVVGPTVGTVASQDPRAGATVSPGALVTIRVGVRRGIKTQMPDVIGKSAEDALELLTAAYDVHVQRTPTPAGEAGNVVRTEPKAGTEIWLRGKVMIYVGSSLAKPTSTVVPSRAPTLKKPERGTRPQTAPELDPKDPESNDPESTDPETADAESEEDLGPVPPLGTPVELPDLTGKDLSVARKAIKRLGLTPNIVRVLDPDAVPNSVVMQVPGGPSEVLAGDIVWLRIAQAAPEGDAGEGGAAQLGARTEQVPALVGLDALRASQEIVRRGLLPHPWYISRAGRRDWEVLAQKDLPGTAIPRGGVVHYRAALPATRAGKVSMPYLYGLTAKQATEVLEGLGLPTKARLVSMSGRVTLQIPQAGAPIAWSTPVTVTIGKVTDAAAAAELPLVVLIPDNTPVPPLPPKKKDGNILDDVEDFFGKLFD